MNLIRKSTWTVLMLGAAIGCAQEEGATPPAGPPPNMPAAPAKVAGPPAAAGETPNKGMSSKMMPPPATGAPKAADATKKDESLKVEGPKAASPKSDETEAKLTADELAKIKLLPAAEQDVAIKQLECPVSGEHLGSMDKPYKVTAEGRTFYLCCKNCEKDLKADPKAAIAKLDKKK
jgi:YHS domain-containing protein